MSIKHLRRPVSRPDGPWWLIRCDCGWEGRTPDMGRTAALIDRSLEEVFRSHLPANEARTHLMVDSRPNPDAHDLDWWIEQAKADGRDEQWARAQFAAQPTIVGTFVMPIGEPAILTSERTADGVHFGTYRTHDGKAGDLPIGEVITPTGRVFRLDQ